MGQRHRAPGRNNTRSTQEFDEPLFYHRIIIIVSSRHNFKQSNTRGVLSLCRLLSFLLFTKSPQTFSGLGAHYTFHNILERINVSWIRNKRWSRCCCCKRPESQRHGRHSSANAFPAGERPPRKMPILDWCWKSVVSLHTYQQYSFYPHDCALHVLIFAAPANRDLRASLCGRTCGVQPHDCVVHCCSKWHDCHSCRTLSEKRALAIFDTDNTLLLLLLYRYLFRSALVKKSHQWRLSLRGSRGRLLLLELNVVVGRLSSRYLSIYLSGLVSVLIRPLVLYSRSELPSELLIRLLALS